MPVITDDDILPVPIKPNFIIDAQYISLIIFQLIKKDPLILNSSLLKFLFSLKGFRPWSQK